MSRTIPFLLLCCIALGHCLLTKDFEWPKEVPNTEGWFVEIDTPLPDHHNWMEKQWDFISSRTLKELTLPGTHDSGSWSVTDELIDVPEWIAEIVKVADFLHVPAGTVIDWWARSQRHNFYDQFKAGIRYVDIRIIYDSRKGYWRTHHGVVLGANIEVLLQHTQQFLQENTKEVLLLELSHEDAVNSTIEQKLLNLIEKYLGPHLWPSTKGFVPLQQMIDAGQNVILTLPFGNQNSKIWSAGTIINSYANSPYLKTMEKFNLEKAIEFSNKKPGPSNLFKMSWTLTPTVETILEMVLPGHSHTLLELASIANQDLDNWFNNTIAPRKFAYPILGNVLIIDDYSNTDVVGIVTRTR